MRKILLTGLMAVLAAPAMAQTAPAAAPAAATTSRPAADKARDAARKPDKVLAFMQVKPGQKVGDFVTGGGYFAGVLSDAVGAGGKVYAFQPKEFIAYRAAYGDEVAALKPRYPNVEPVIASFVAPAFPEPLDAVVTIQNWHDLHLKMVPAGADALTATALFNALKPGGVLVVVDHSAVAGSPASVGDTLHRTTPEVVIPVLEKAGFKLEAKDTTTFANPADPRTANVFTPAIRGKTDQFMLRFRKPA